MKNFLSNIKLNFINNLDVFLFLIIVPIKLIFFAKHIEPKFYFYHSLFYSTFAAILIIVCMSYVFFIKIRSKVLIIINIIITLLIITDLNYFRYFKDILSILVVKNIFQLSSVKSSVSSIFKIQDLLYLTDIFLILLLKPFLGC